MKQSLTPATFSLVTLAILSTLVATQRTCANCPNNDLLTADKRLCASDGLLYTDLFCAQCASNNENYEFFTCSASLSSTDCQSLCTEQTRIYRCNTNCPGGYSGNYICNDSGRVYSNLCREACNNPIIVDLFNCNRYDFSVSACSQKCGSLARCKVTYASIPSHPICGKDALKYNSLEELKCNGEYLVILDAQGAPVYEGIGDCKAHVELTIGRPVGKELPPIYIPQ